MKGRHLFSKVVVGYCLVMLTIITAAVVYVECKSEELSSGVVTALCGVWGGELLFLCLKRIFGEKTSTVTAGDAQEGAANNDGSNNESI